ncbi:glycine/betaine ABC transporter permease [Paenibacillus sambharensis]|uniref:Glycine/betaine ABC transporter permease n=1 Tax=Paenibacillus sambharensis TaxID=1803190 RepID=A0A2W1LS04_9BACL|nr:BCCT family transporter [Paenibacillus sambharensis]PZD97555.1 glycine/betaine ABC transporter permease [Paenibacillus sambharensis]
MKKRVFKNPVFLVSASITIVLVILGAVMPRQFEDTANKLFHFTTEKFGWFYMLVVGIIILLLIGLAISKYGGIRLGGEDQKPEFPFLTWIGMLFSAGFGVGLVFWGVAEPMSHFAKTPFADVEANTEEAARIALGYAFFHWGISQWAVFALVGLIIALLWFRKQKDGLVSTALEPVTGSKPVIKHSIDSFAVIATVMGVATSVGLGVLQMNSGLNTVFGLGEQFYVQVGIILAVFAAYTVSSTTGLNKGIRYLSNVNLGLALGLMLFVFFAGPTVFILKSFTLALGDYITNFVYYSTRIQPYGSGSWLREWTLFYWAWAIAWSPYVGAFIARVSKGRTVREFIIGVMFIPPAIACVWISVLGGTALWQDLYQNTDIASVVDQDNADALFQLFEQLPLTNILSVLAILLIFVFLVTSADSATFILGSMTTYGSLHPKKRVKITWGVLVAAIAGVLLNAGGLRALQTASLVAALPFTVLLLLLGFGMVKLIRKEPLPIHKADIERFRRLREKSDRSAPHEQK